MTLLIIKNTYFFATANSLKDIYLNNIAKTQKFKDNRQLQILQSFQRLNDQIIISHDEWLRSSKETKFIKPQIKKQQATEQKKYSFFKSIFGFSETNYSQSYNPSPINYIKGIYLYGSSGCGKTFLSELFYNNLNIKEKNKFHFHQFMADVQKDLFRLQQEKRSYDPLVTIANKRAKQTRLLFLDQFQVTDVADASILKRLFQKLIENQMILVATSNREPDELYKNGHQREHFVPFIKFIKQKCQIIDAKSSKDYRYDLEVQTQQRSYFSPLDDISDKKLDNTFMTLSKQQVLQYDKITIQVIKGRNLIVPRSKNGICLYYFDELCDDVMGDSDFRAICRTHKAIIVKNIPKISTHNRNIANRFIKLLDQVYVNNVKFYCNAQVGLQQIIKSVKPEDAVTQQEFAINRCKSRLVQFQAKKYKQKKSYLEQNSK